MTFQEKLEKNVWALLLMVALVVSVGGIVEIVPLFYLENTIEKLSKEEDSIRPYTALEQEGRDIYVREGCYLCHSQMIRPFRDEKERYGHYSLAAESMYDHPFQWGSKRTGPDLARVGGRYGFVASAAREAAACFDLLLVAALLASTEGRHKYQQSEHFRGTQRQLGASRGCAVSREHGLGSPGSTPLCRLAPVVDASG